MINTLSILIPTYNNVCFELVRSLQAQASLLSVSASDFKYEIIVADDGSTDKTTIEGNRIINTLPHCRYIEREKNVGRAAIRNFLAKEAQYPWLLFIDSNMNVINNEYLANYQKEEEESDVIYGGYQIKRDADTQERLKYNLRYIFELAGVQNGDYRLRQINPYGDFHTSNFIAKRSIMLKYPFDERFFHYGYEDVLWGKTLKDNQISIHHVDNPLGYEHFIGNMSFINKTEESLHTLYQFRKELQEYSKIISYANKVKGWHLYAPCQRLFPLLSLPIKARLTGNKPSIFLFNIYKLLYYIHLDT
jgi:glycosyltransferase involved in cell wall biosynthesis